MIDNKFLEILIQVGAIHTDDHFVYTSGRHGPSYVNKDDLYTNPRATSVICNAMSLSIFDEQNYIEAVLAPALGGIALTQWTAHHLGVLQNTNVLALYAEKVPILDSEQRLTGHQFEMTRGYAELLEGKRTLILEDILTTGGSAAKIVQLGRKHHAEIVGVSAICNRGGITAAKLEVPVLHSLVDFPLESYPKENCPLCKAKVPINQLYGKGKDFLQAVEAWP